MNILITGTRGVVGGVLKKHFQSKGFKVVESKGRDDFESVVESLKLEDSIDIVIHAGANVDFSAQFQDEFQSETISNTQKLIKKINELFPSAYFILIGAAGIHGVSKDEEFINEASVGVKSNLFLDYDMTQYIFDKKGQRQVLQNFKGKSCSLNLTTLYCKEMNPNTLKALDQSSDKRILPTPPGGTSYLGKEDFLNSLQVCVDKKIEGEYIISSGNILFTDMFKMVKEVKRCRRPYLIFSIPKHCIYLFLLLNWAIKKINKSVAVLISSFGFKFYSTRKFEEKVGFKFSQNFKLILKELLD